MSANEIRWGRRNPDFRRPVRKENLWSVVEMLDDLAAQCRKVGNSIEASLMRQRADAYMERLAA